jgi:hypothetical protein
MASCLGLLVPSVQDRPALVEPPLVQRGAVTIVALRCRDRVLGVVDPVEAGQMREAALAAGVTLTVQSEYVAVFLRLYPADRRPGPARLG